MRVLARLGVRSGVRGLGALVAVAALTAAAVAGAAPDQGDSPGAAAVRAAAAQASSPDAAPAPAPSTPGTGAPTLAHLDPGGPVDLHQDVPVTVVYVGLEPGAPPTGIDAAAVEAAQPAGARPLVLSRVLNGYGRDLGLSYAYDYESVFADQAFEDAFFGHLAAIAIGPVAPTVYQEYYSYQPRAGRVVDENWIVDAVAAEAWLATNAGPMLGVDTSRPTVFFVNWYGRPDFRFHTYAPFHRAPGNPVPYGFTGFGQVTAWGGSTPDDPQFPLPSLARLWLYDVSAGPDGVSGNWELVARSHLAGDPDVPDDRLPPIWEYGTDHWFRPFDDLSADLARVLRYVAVDGLFTASPYSDPAISPPLLTDDVEVDINVFTDPTKGVRGDPLATLPSIPTVTGSLAALDPTRRWTGEVETGFSVLTLEEPFNCTAGFLVRGDAEPCADDPSVPTAYFDLGFALDGQRGQTLEGRRGELPVALLDVPDHRWVPFPGSVYGLEQAFTGLPSWSLAFDAPYLQGALYTPDEATLFGSALYLGFGGAGFSVDTEQATIQYGSDASGFLLLMNGSASVTSNLPFTLQFSQFDRDDMARWMTAVRLQWANRILADVYASGRAGRVAARLLAADARAGEAEALLAAWDMRGASAAAQAAYREVLGAAAALKISVESWSGRDDQGPVGFAAWAQDPVVDGTTASARPVAGPRTLGGGEMAVVAHRPAGAPSPSGAVNGDGAKPIPALG